MLTQEQWEIFRAVFDRIRNEGFRTSELEQFESEGFTTAEIEVLRERFSADLSGFPVVASLEELLDGFADTLEAQLAPTEAFVRNAASVAGRTNEPPVASFAATPASGEAPLPVSFEDASTSSDLDPIVSRQSARRGRRR